jgi:hypothetical protein
MLAPAGGSSYRGRSSPQSKVDATRVANDMAAHPEIMAEVARLTLAPFRSLHQHQILVPILHTHIELHSHFLAIDASAALAPAIDWLGQVIARPVAHSPDLKPECEHGPPPQIQLYRMYTCLWEATLLVLDPCAGDVVVVYLPNDHGSPLASL